MSVRLHHLLSDRRTITIPIGDNSLTVIYRPSALTPEMEDRLYERLQEQRGGAGLVAFIAATVVEWDLLDDDDSPIPVTENALRTLPVQFLNTVITALAADLRPNA